jgi:hypothetical protein
MSDLKDYPQLSDPHQVPEGREDNSVDQEMVMAYAVAHSEAILLVPPLIQRAMLWVAGEHAQLDERQLEYCCSPDSKTKMLRINFWNEYYAAVRAERRMDTMSIYRTVCTHKLFLHRLHVSAVCCWIFRPMSDYTMFMEQQLHHGLQRIAEILALPITVNGKVSTQTANLIMRTVQMVENRVKGAIVQKHEHKSLNLSIDAGSALPKDLIELEKKIALLEGADVSTLAAHVTQADAASATAPVVVQVLYKSEVPAPDPTPDASG